jgi:hypothetical protein
MIPRPVRARPCAWALALAAFVAAPQALAQTTPPLLAGATPAGAPADPVPGDYALVLPPAFNGATITVTETTGGQATQTLSYTAQPASAPVINVPAGTLVSASASGGTPTGATTLNALGTSPVAGARAGPAYGAAGTAPLAFSLTSASASAAFTPAAGRVFHLVIPAGTMSAACYVERQPDGANWTLYTVNGVALYALTLNGASVSEDIYEAESGVPYRLDCGAQSGAYTSGTIAGSFRQ